jgi:hypothetical protein
MKSCKTTLYFSILTLTVLPLSVRAMGDIDDGDADIAQAGALTNNNNNKRTNPFKEDIDFDQLTKAPRFEDFDKENIDYDLFDLTTAASQQAHIDEMNAPVLPADKNESSLSGVQRGSLVLGALSTGAYVFNNINLAPLTRSIRGIDIDGTKSASLGVALAQTILSAVETMALPGVIIAGFAFTHQEIRKKALLEELSKKQKRQIEQQDEYIRRLTKGLTQHELAAHQVVQAHYKTLTNIHSKILPLAQVTVGKNCDTCKETHAATNLAVQYVAKKITELKDVHDDIPGLIANKDHKVTWNPKTWFQKLRDVCRKHQEDNI